MGLIAFADIETTGLNPAQHAVWEVGVIIRQHEDRPETDVEYRWQLKLTETEVRNADPEALQICDFEMRYHEDEAIEAKDFAPIFAFLTRGAHIFGMNPAFDDERLRIVLEEQDQTHGWSYHLVDLTTMAMGFLAAKGRPLRFPYKSNEVAGAIGIRVAQYERHTALGDCRMARDLFDVMRSAVMEDRPTRVREQ